MPFGFGENNDSFLRRKLEEHLANTKSVTQAVRLLEEDKYEREVVKKRVTKISKVTCRLDRDGDFEIRFRGGKNKKRIYLICVILQDASNITSSECQCVYVALKLTERGTQVTDSQFKEWRSHLNNKGQANFSENKSANAYIMNVRPNPESSQTLETRAKPGYIRKCTIGYDRDRDFVVIFETDCETFGFIIQQNEINESLSDLQQQAIKDVIGVAEPGDKMDESMFLHYCAQLEGKYNLLKTIRNESGVLIAHIVPTPVEKQNADVNFESEVPLPPLRSGKPDWSQATKERIDRLAHSTATSTIPDEIDMDPNTVDPELAKALRLSMEEERARQERSEGAPSVKPWGTYITDQGKTRNLPVYGSGKVMAKSLVKESGQASVFKGSMKRGATTEDVAIKVFHQQGDWEICKQELVSLMANSNHKNVMQIYDFYEVPKPCIVMRFVGGGDLRDYLDRHGRFQSREAYDVLAGIGAGLQYLHSNGFVHRDIKSPNIVLEGPERKPVLIDMGLGKLMEDGNTAMTSDFKGTAQWLAPEMITDHKWNTKTDIYALGVVMWEVLSGKVPFHSCGNFYQVIHLVAGGGRPDLGDLDFGGGGGDAVTEDMKGLIQMLW
eukprot:CAMPEP_0168744872 /NCGR_PEP_ID=MMETSP0724-20121128/14319_1 /TAXON_ID=265536 /ORGANISM="Amphiprora sp., Strain CCMP467" /LENGTH=610 /DNA_ID=CAMNT_0008792553 /DNA_START=30 /DNA_END=1859 /DNA_ORIENTATION=+